MESQSRPADPAAQGTVDGVHENAERIEDLEVPASAGSEVRGGASSWSYFVDHSSGDWKVLVWKD